MPTDTAAPRVRWLSDAEAESFDFKSALGGAAQGAGTGAVAGPWGALIGAVGGAALSLANKKPKKQRVAASPTAAPAVGTAPATPATPTATEPSAAAAPVSTSTTAAPTAGGQLGQLLGNPVFQQAVSGLASGQGGNSGIPTASILNLLGALANNAAYEAEAIEGEADDSYLRDSEGRFVGDLANPLERAARVWDRLFPPGSDASIDSESTSNLAAWLINSGLATAR